MAPSAFDGLLSSDIGAELENGLGLSILALESLARAPRWLLSTAADMFWDEMRIRRLGCAGGRDAGGGVVALCILRRRFVADVDSAGHVHVGRTLLAVLPIFSIISLIAEWVSKFALLFK